MPDDTNKAVDSGGEFTPLEQSIIADFQQLSEDEQEKVLDFIRSLIH